MSTAAIASPTTTESAATASPGTAESVASARTLETIRAIDDFYRRVDELYRQTAARMGLADCDFDILYALSDEDGLTRKQLGERGFSSKQTVHSAVKRMVAKGFVAMRGDSPRTMRAYLHRPRPRALLEAASAPRRRENAGPWSPPRPAAGVRRRPQPLCRRLRRRT